MRDNEETKILKRYLRKIAGWEKSEINEYVDTGMIPHDRSPHDVDMAHNMVEEYKSWLVSPYTGATIKGVGERLIFQLFVQEKNIGTKCKRIKKETTLQGIHMYYSLSKKDREKIYENKEYGVYVVPPVSPVLSALI